MAENPSEGLENTVRKGEVTFYEQFVLQTSKNKGLFGKGIKIKIVWLNYRALKGWLIGERVGLMTCGGCEYDPWLRRTFFLVYFCLSPLQ